MANINDVATAVQTVIRDITPFAVEVEKLDYATEWSKTLFAQIKKNQTLDVISRRLQKMLDKNFQLDPHLSLVYKEEMTEEEKQKEIARITVPDSITIDRIAITTPTNPVEKWKDLTKWRTPFIFRLGS